MKGIKMLNKVVMSGFILVVMSIVSLTSFAEVITHDYDKLNRRIKTYYPDGTVVDYIYDEAGNKINTIVTVVETDTDGDGLLDRFESILCTDLDDADSDDDGIPDNVEDADHDGEDRPGVLERRDPLRHRLSVN
jgi:hypothetical protein